MATSAVPPAKRRVRKRIWIPSVLLGALALFVLWLVWRGTSVDATARNPTSADEGAVTQLLNEGEGTFVRTAIIVPAPPAEVWKVVTDYDSHPKFIRYVSELSSRKIEGGLVRLTGIAHSRLWGDFPFESDVTHTEKPAEGEYAAGWDDEGRAGFLVDRGGWTLKRLPGERTLLVFRLQMEVEGYPNFLIRNILLDRLGTIVESMRAEVAKRGGG